MKDEHFILVCVICGRQKLKTASGWYQTKNSLYCPNCVHHAGQTQSEADEPPVPDFIGENK